MSCFFLAMTLFPEVQLKAQEEIDRIVGTKRLPNFEDRANLPYVDAIVKEVLRWHPVGPIGLPHMTTEDDIFNGYLIPKGALMFANIWYASTFYSLLLPISTQSWLTSMPQIGPSLMTPKYTMIHQSSSQSVFSTLPNTNQNPIRTMFPSALGAASVLAASSQTAQSI
jgi:hypothetical protein